MVRRLISVVSIGLLFALALATTSHAQTTPGTPAATAGPNMGTLPQEAVAWLEGLIRINTTNPPGNELAAANYIAGILEKEGIPHEVIEITPGRAIVVGRLNASVMPDASRSLLTSRAFGCCRRHSRKMDGRSFRRRNSRRLSLRPRHD